MPTSYTGAPALYEIRVAGAIDDGWSDWLGGMAITPAGAGTTRIAGALADQSALLGILAQLHMLNLALISVRRLPSPAAEGRPQQRRAGR
jgi:hypothetical protein